MKNDIIELFEKGKLLARAMDFPGFHIDSQTKTIYNDFSVWANEYEKAKEEGLDSLSTTLLVPEEAIPPYKATGFLINSDKVDVIHVSETDSVSKGSIKKGDFHAAESDIQSLEELQNVIKVKHENVMNEVNINMREDAYAGIFARKVDNEGLIARILLAQKAYEIQTGIILPTYIYDSEQGKLDILEMSLEEKTSVIQKCLDNKVLRSSGVFYQTERGEEKSFDYIEEIEKDMKKENAEETALLSSAVEATEEVTKSSTINGQIQSIEEVSKGDQVNLKQNNNAEQH